MAAHDFFVEESPLPPGFSQLKMSLAPNYLLPVEEVPGPDLLPVEEVPDGTARLQDPAEAGREELLSGDLQPTLPTGAEVVIQRKVQIRLLL